MTPSGSDMAARPQPASAAARQMTWHAPRRHPASWRRATQRRALPWPRAKARLWLGSATKTLNSQLARRRIDHGLITVAAPQREGGNVELLPKNSRGKWLHPLRLITQWASGPASDRNSRATPRLLGGVRTRAEAKRWRSSAATTRATGRGPLTRHSRFTLSLSSGDHSIGCSSRCYFNQPFFPSRDKVDGDTDLHW